MQRRRAQTWAGVGKTAQAAAAHAALFCFTLPLALRVDGRPARRRVDLIRPVGVDPGWLVAGRELLLCFPFRGMQIQSRGSSDADARVRSADYIHPAMAISWSGCPWKVFNAGPFITSWASSPLLIAFELLLCIYLESLRVKNHPAVDMKIVFLPLLTFEVIILVDNFRMCKALMPGDEESMSDEAIWETLPDAAMCHVSISCQIGYSHQGKTLLAFLGRNLYGVSYSCDNLHTSQVIWPPTHGEASSSSSAIRYRDWESGLVLPSLEDHEQERICGLPDIGGHLMKIPLVVFQVLLCMRLEGTPPSARYIPIFALFSPLFILQGAGVLFSIGRLVEKVVLLLRNGPVSPNYLTVSSKVRDCFAFLHHGSRLLGWWSIDEGSKEEQARLFYTESNGYNTFSGYPPEVVKKMPKKDLAEEVWRLQAALGEQSEITKSTQQEYERLQNVMC
ncbi:hypothetical protein TRIUR3_18791 [Triticum urartu]|uniref:Uncharacterized protein n=1 Tax=Triticum urartu TaxID=4572 RepID=M8AVP9_TRIUA|nr:hypothetical protein TRIUR3_18791 [Triticum urartu]